MGEGDEGRGSRRICVLNPGMFFFFLSSFFYKHLCTETIHTATTSTMRSNPGCSPPPLYGMKEVGVKEVGMKGVEMRMHLEPLVFRHVQGH